MDGVVIIAVRASGKRQMDKLTARFSFIHNLTIFISKIDNLGPCVLKRRHLGHDVQNRSSTIRRCIDWRAGVAIYPPRLAWGGRRPALARRRLADAVRVRSGWVRVRVRPTAGFVTVTVTGCCGPER